MEKKLIEKITEMLQDKNKDILLLVYELLKRF